MCKVFYDMVKIAKKTCHLNEKNCDRYLKECKKIISRGVETELRELGAEIRGSIPKIVEYAFEQATSSKKSKVCRELLSIFERPNFCKSLVLHNCDTCFNLVEAFQSIANKKSDNLPPESIKFVQQLIKQAFGNEDSILYNDITLFDGSEKQKLTFTEFTFRDLNFVESAFDPLISIGCDHDTPSNRMFDKLLEISIFILHLKSKQEDKSVKSFTSNFFHMLFRISRDVINVVIYCNYLPGEEEIRYVKQVNYFWSGLLHAIGGDVDESIKEKYQIENLLINRFSEEEISVCIYDFINNVSFLGGDDSKLERFLLYILCNPYYEPNETTSNILTKVKDKILENLNAHMIRTLLNTFGLVRWGRYGNCPWAEELHTKLFCRLREDFELIMSVGAGVVWLPSYMEYDATQSVIRDRRRPDKFLSLRDSHAD